MQNHLRFISNHSSETIARVEQMLESGALARSLSERYPEQNTVRTDKALYAYVMDLKKRFLKSSAPISAVLFDKKISIYKQALGLHSTKSRVQGKKLKSKSEIRIAELFKEAPAKFFHAVVVHELAHLKEKGHDKPFYKLCEYMEPEYHQHEFDMRLWLVLQSYQNSTENSDSPIDE